MKFESFGIVVESISVSVDLETFQPKKHVTFSYTMEPLHDARAVMDKEEVMELFKKELFEKIEDFEKSS